MSGGWRGKGRGCFAKKVVVGHLGEGGRREAKSHGGLHGRKRKGTGWGKGQF